VVKISAVQVAPLLAFAALRSELDCQVPDVCQDSGGIHFDPPRNRMLLFQLVTT
jgi:hypothetical protein